MMRNVSTRLGILILATASSLKDDPTWQKKHFWPSIYLAGYRCILCTCTRLLVQLMVPISGDTHDIISQQITFEPRAYLQQQLPLLQYC